MRAHEPDVLHAGLLAFLDLEHQIDTVVRQFDDLRIDRHVEAAAAVIDLNDPLHIGLHHRFRQGAARLRLNFGLKLFVLGFFVTLEGDAIDHRVFDHADYQAPVLVTEAHVLEQASGVERVDGVVDLRGANLAARASLEIGPNRFGFDAAVALHDDGTGGLRDRNACRRHDHSPGTDKGTPEDQTTDGQSP